jgi:RNA polymerase sigma-70 factor (ECF subfamily)
LGRGGFLTRLTKIAVKTPRLKQIRSGVAAEPEGTMSLESNILSAKQEVLAHSLTAVLESAVDRLPEAYRSVFMLREVEGLGTAETSECLDLGEETVKLRLRRARALIRQHVCAETSASTLKAFQFLGVRCNRMVSAVLKRIEALEVSAPAKNILHSSYRIPRT